MRSKADEYEKIIDDMIKLQKQIIDHAGCFMIEHSEWTKLVNKSNNLIDLYEYKKAKKD